jgi:hypothetical protein
VRKTISPLIRGPLIPRAERSTFAALSALLASVALPRSQQPQAGFGRPGSPETSEPESGRAPEADYLEEPFSVCVGHVFEPYGYGAIFLVVILAVPASRCLAPPSLAGTKPHSRFVGHNGGCRQSDRRRQYRLLGGRRRTPKTPTFSPRKRAPIDSKGRQRSESWSAGSKATRSQSDKAC